MAKRPDKKSMPCNKPRASTSAGKKKMVKACANGQEKIIPLEQKVMVTTIVRKLVSLSKHGIIATLRIIS